MLAVLLASAWVAPVGAQPQERPSVQAADEEIIATIRANGVARGEFTLVRTAAGDFWVAAADLERLKVTPLPAARREFQGQAYYSLQGLGATQVVFDPAQLALALDFPAAQLQPTAIDLSYRPQPIEPTPPRTSTIFNYRATAFQAGEDTPVRMRLASDLNVRIGETLLRQEAKYETHRNGPSFVRGVTQLIWDDRLGGRRLVGGDQLTAGGPFGTAITAAGASLTRLFAITPDVLRQPTANLQVSAAAPAEVEVAIDGSTVYRTNVAPGPVSLQNLFHYGGARTVRVTVTDVTGQRQVVEQPFLFTDTVLAKGLHEYSYFAGRRSELGADDRWRYRESVWQGFHRYGVNDSLTVEAGGEGNGDFASGGGGVTLRHDVLGLVALGALHSTDHAASRDAKGWSARYTYASPLVSLSVGRRRLEPGFRTFANAVSQTALLSETRVGASTRLSDTASLSLDYGRVHETTGSRTNYALRYSTYLSNRASVHAEYVSNRASVHAEYVSNRFDLDRNWAFNVYLRLDLERQRWVGSTVRTASGVRTLEVETGRQLNQNEGAGYRVGTNWTRAGDEERAFAFGSATWNLRPVTLEFNGTSQVRGGNNRFLEASAIGSVVAVDGYVGATRQVGDSFALARLGVPQQGVEVFLNSQMQGRTGADGTLLIPNIGAFGRQDVSINDKQLSMDYDIAAKRVTIAPAYRSGSVVDFGGRELRAVTGQAWLVRGGTRQAIANARWTLAGDAGRLNIETATSGDFYLENAAPGRYTGTIETGGKTYSCRVTIPTFKEAVHELQEGIVCE